MHVYMLLFFFILYICVLCVYIYVKIKMVGASKQSIYIVEELQWSRLWSSTKRERVIVEGEKKIDRWNIYLHTFLQLPFVTTMFESFIEYYLPLNIPLLHFQQNAHIHYKFISNMRSEESVSSTSSSSEITINESNSSRIRRLYRKFSSKQSHKKQPSAQLKADIIERV